MDVVRLTDPSEFLERAQPHLLADESRHNLMLGLGGTLRDHPGLYPEHRLWLVEDRGTVVGASLRTPPYNLVLAGGTDAAVDALAGAIDESLPGVVGARPEVDRFVSAWTERHGVRAEAQVRQGIYALQTVAPPPAPTGRPRAAAEADRLLLVSWWGAFGAEALGELEQDEDQNTRSVDHRLATPGNGVWLWEDEGEIVSLVAFGNPTPSGVRIGPVYTPPEHRGRGYASALTAHVSSRALAAGRSFCFLYTDLSNPTSNKIYTAIGYKRVCDAIQYGFS